MQEDRRPNVGGYVPDGSEERPPIPADPEQARRRARLLTDREGADGHEEAGSDPAAPEDPHAPPRGESG